MSTRIYTRAGDAGDTGLFGGQRVRKDNLRVEAYGTLDELNAQIGLLRTQLLDADIDGWLGTIQNTLFALGSDLATPDDADTHKGRVTIQRLDAEPARQLEEWIDRCEAELPPLRNFILPGGHPVAAHMHLARVVCRRVERRCVTLADSEMDAGKPAPNPEILRYLNRLSDLFFVLARLVNHRNGVPDTPWNP